MNERVLAKNKTSATPSQAIQASSPPLHQGPFTSEVSESFGRNSNISKESGGIQPKTIRRSLNWQNISVEAPSRSDGRSSPGAIQRQQEEPGAVIGSRVSADSAQKPLIARAPLNGRNIPVEAPPRSAVSSTSPGGIQCLETSDVKEQQKSTESLQMQPEEAIQAKSSQDQLQEKEEQNKESVQTKLTVGAPGDKYEQEADSMAAKVMRMPDSAIQQPIQRQTGKETEAVQMQPLVNSITPVVQRSSGKEEEVQMKSGVQRASDGSSVASGSLENQLAGSKGGGSALPDDVRSFMEPRFGADFSNIKVHTDSNAVQMNKELGAQAFAHGSDIYYGAGKSPGKNELTAHELTHVVQQNNGVVQRYFVRNGDSQEHLTQEQVREECRREGLNDEQINKVLEKEGSNLQRRRLDKCIDIVKSSQASTSQASNRRNREEEDGTENIEGESTINEMMEALEERKEEDSYADDGLKIHKILKEDPDDACFNWALRGLSKTGRPLPEELWNVRLDMPDAAQGWMKDLDDEIRHAIVELTKKIATNGLTFQDYINNNFKFPDTGKQNQAQELMIEACRLIVRSNGMTPVDDNEAEAWVVCQYLKVNGAAGRNTGG